MPHLIRHEVLRRLLAAACALGTGAAGAALLAEVPEDVLAQLVDEVDAEGVDWEDRAAVVRLLSEDPRPTVRARAADVAGSLWPVVPEQALEALARLASDAAPEVHLAASGSLARLLVGVSPVHRVEIVCTWVLAEARGVRLAVARALSLRTPLLMTDLAIEQLASDPDAEVRSLAAAAARSHHDEHPESYGRLLERLSVDPSALVRAAALSQNT